VRFLFYTPWWRPDGQSSNFVPANYDPTKAPRMYVPVVVNGSRYAQDPLTGQLLNEILVGAFVPGTGNEANGMVLGTTPGQAKGFRDTLPPTPEPRIGFAYDITGDGKTALHASAGLFHNARLGGGQLGNIAANPPFIHNPIIYYSTLSSLTNAPSAQRPSNLNALEVHAQTPSSANLSVGVQREIGWGTVIDASYIGTLGRHLEMEENINALADGVKFVDLHPENKDPRTGIALPNDYLRPYIGYGDIFVRGNWGTSNYNALQVQANRRYIHGVQFGVAYTWSKSMGIGDDDPARVSIYRDVRAWNYAPNSFSQAHNLVINYTWDIPSPRVNNPILRGALDGWQLSGENAFVSGDWAIVTMSTTDNFDFTGGDGGNGASLAGGGDGLRTVRPVVVGTPMLANGNPATGWLNAAAFARPARGTFGNEARNSIQKPGTSNWNLSAFKNFPMGGSRRLQFRAEAYNVLNHTQFSDIDRNVQFDAAGNQVNAAFGTATAVRQPRTMQMSVRFTF